MLKPTRDLVTPRRWDLAVKWRFFNHLLHGNDPDSERVYRWHLATRKAANAKINLGMDSKGGTDQYVEDCRNLIVSIKSYGFLPQFAVPIDPDGELLGGAHRVACALALRLDEIPVRQEMRRVWAPAWGKQWFLENGVPNGDLSRIEMDFEGLHV